MTEKTALTELLDRLQSFRLHVTPAEEQSLKEFIRLAKVKERQNLIDAHDKGQLVEEQHTIPQRRINKAEQYVKEKFGI